MDINARYAPGVDAFSDLELSVGARPLYVASKRNPTGRYADHG
jgi:hypothetical protein